MFWIFRKNEFQYSGGICLVLQKQIELISVRGFWLNLIFDRKIQFVKARAARNCFNYLFVFTSLLQRVSSKRHRLQLANFGTGQLIYSDSLANWSLKIYIRCYSVCGSKRHRLWLSNVDNGQLFYSDLLADCFLDLFVVIACEF